MDMLKKTSMFGRKKIRRNGPIALVSSLLCGVLLFGSSSFAASVDTGVLCSIEAAGRYVNWDGVTNVAQFAGPDGNLYFAVDSDNTVTVYKTDGTGKVTGNVALAKQHPTFGTAICDAAGNYYLVTGETNTTDDTSVNTIFISKYSSTGTHIATVGDNGSSSLAYYYNNTFYTKYPFEAGNCDAAINGNILTVTYGRKMYSGHQSNSVFTVNITDMSKVNVGSFYESHSFAQRVVPTPEGFAYVSEGDCYDRAFTLYSVKLSGNECTYTNEGHLFDFWVEDGALESYNMYVLNDNFAHMGGLVTLSDGKVAFAAQSATSLSEEAENEAEQIFIQIFDPYGDLKNQETYTTKGARGGLAGPNGRDAVGNYGVTWLTGLDEGCEISNVQIACTSENKIVILYEMSENYSYSGVYYMVLDEEGKTIVDYSLFSRTARLNPCEMPVSVGKNVSWVGNSNSDNKIYTYTLDPSIDYEAQIRNEEENGQNGGTDGGEGTGTDDIDTDGGERTDTDDIDTDGGEGTDTDDTDTDGEEGTGTDDTDTDGEEGTDTDDTDTDTDKGTDNGDGTGKDDTDKGTDGGDKNKDDKNSENGGKNSNNSSEYEDDPYYKALDDERKALVPSGYQDKSGSPMKIEGKDCAWNDAAGKSYWYENGIKQGTYFDNNAVLGDGTVRGREIYDAASDGWYWLDAIYNGAKAIGKEVWMPYIYQDEDGWDDAKMREIANESDEGMRDLVYDYMKNKKGKWVRYDENGKMLKGWITISGALVEKYPDQEGNTYYYDNRTGLMAKGWVKIGGKDYFFDEVTGALQ